MTENTLLVFAKISPKREHYEEAKQAIMNILQPTQAEPGCRQFELYENSSEGHLYLFEEWESEQALEAHYQQPYTLEVFESYEEWLARPVEVEKMWKC